MANIHHFDVIILGAGLWGRMAAVLLAGKGLRVMTFVDRSGPIPDFLPLSPTMKHLVSFFSPLASHPRPTVGFQVITPDIRLDLSGPLPLEEELRRELPDSWEQVRDLLGRLEDLGNRLEGTILRHSQASASVLGGRLMLHGRLLASGLAFKGISRKFPALLEGLADRLAQQMLTTLFAGLTLRDPRSLTVAEAALLWNSATRPRGVNGDELQQAVERVFQKSHGQSRTMDDLTALEVGGNRLQFALLRDGTRLGAGCFLVDRYPDPALWPKGWKMKARPVPVLTDYWQLTEITPGPSSLLAPRVVLAGSPPLLLTLCRHTEKGWEGRVNQAVGTSLPLLENDQLRRRLESVLPFADYRLQRRHEQSGVSIPWPRFPHFGPQRIGPGALYCGASTAQGELFDIYPPLVTLMATGVLGKKAR